jgi:hypothetical protein
MAADEERDGPAPLSLRQHFRENRSRKDGIAQ